MKQPKFTKLLTFSAVLIVVAVSLFVALRNTSETAEAAWFDDSWHYRNTYTIGNTGAAVTSQKVKLDIDTASLIAANKMNSDCSDARFTNASGQLLPYYLDSSGGACNTSSTDYYVLMDNINGSDNTLLYFYYGNATAPDTGQGSQFSESTFAPTSGPTLGSEETGKAPSGYWSFDEGYGSTAYNTGSTTSTDATISGAEWRTSSQCVSGSCLYFDGSTDVATVSGTLTGIKSVAFWVKSSSTTAALIDLNSSAYVSASSGTLSATGFTSPSIYVNGLRSTTLVANEWQYVTVTTGTAISASAITIGQVSNDYLGGFIDEVKLYPYALSTTDVKAAYAARGSVKGASVQVGSRYNLNDGLVGYWPMDESAANSCTDGSTDSCDASGAGNDATWYNNVTPTSTAKFGRGLEFDGVADVVDAGNDSSLTMTDQFSVAGWMYFNSLNNNNAIIARSASRSPWNLGQYSNNKAWVALTWSDNTYVDYHVGALSTHTWHHVAFTFDYVTGNTRIYIDGEEVGNFYKNPGLQMKTTTSSVNFGGGGSFFDGVLDDVRIYNRVLSPDEMKALYNWAPGPEKYYSMEEKVSGDGQTINDVTGSGVNGATVDGSNNTGMDCTVRGKYGGGCEFDGVDDYISISSSLGTFGSISASVWFNPTTVDGTQNIILDDDGFLRVEVNSSNKVLVGFGDSGWGDLSSGVSIDTISPNHWYHVVSVLDTKQDQAYLYLNGALQATWTETKNITSVNNLTIGDYETTHGTYNFPGRIDDVQIYNYPLTYKQVVNVMSARGGSASGGNSGSSQQTTLHWSFDSIQGTSVFDSGPNRFTATFTNTPTSTDAGKIGKAIVFNRADVDYITTPDDYALDIGTGSITVSMWAKTDQYTNASIPVSKGAPYAGCINTGRMGYEMRQYDTYYNFSVCHYDTSAGAGSANSPTFTTTDNEWHHIVGVYDRDLNKIYMYVDGKRGSLSTPTIVATDDVDSTSKLSLGGRSGAHNFSGTIDEFKIYHYALTQEEVENEYIQGGKAVRLGEIGTDSSGSPSSSASQAYCIPGDTSTCRGPVGEWHMDERISGDSKTLYDSSVNGNDGSTVDGSNNTGMDCTARGKIGRACEYDNSDDYVTVTDDNTLDFGTGDFTLMAWGKSRTSSQRDFFFDKGYDPTDGASYGFFMEINEADTLVAGYGCWGGTCGAADYTSIVITDRQGWHHYAAVYARGDSQVRLYRDGLLIKTGSLSQSWSLDNTADLIIGADRNTGSTSNPFDGWLDEVKVFDYALTDAQVAWNYNHGGPTAYWKFDEGEGGTAHDASGNGNHGTLSIGGTGTQTVNSDAWSNGSSGKQNGSLYFDGTDDYVTVPDNDFLEPPRMSFGAWFKTSASSEQYFIHKADDNYYVRMNAGQIGYFINSVCASWLNTTKTFNDDEWHYVLVTYDGPTRKIYVDAQLEASSSCTNGSVPTGVSSVSIGTRGTPYWFTGQIDEVKLWSYALTPEQIKQEYNGGAIMFGPSSGTP